MYQKKQQLKTYNNFLEKGIRLAKRCYYETLFTKFKNDIRGTRKTINKILNKTKQKETFLFFVKIADNIMYDKKTITNKFNIIFANIDPNISEKIKMPRNKTFHSYLTGTQNNNFQFKNINEETALQIIDNLASKISCGLDGISSKLLRQ